MSSELHVPVMLNEILENFAPVAEERKLISANETSQASGLRYLDGTFGRGGHFAAVLSKFSIREAVALDRDDDALAFGRERFASEVATSQVRFIKSNYCDFSDLNLGLFDIILLDLGVSSPQLDVAERGFSFYHEGPLDMRMDQSQNLTAAEVVNTFSESELIEVFKELGEINNPFRVVRAIVHDRKEKQFSTTRELAGLIERVDGWRQKGFHPATRYFMALRLVVNNELGSVEKAMEPLMRGLAPGGRLAILTFHSLEDRIVKNIFRSMPELGEPVSKKVIHPSREEEKENPRARSAKLRVFRRNSS